MNTSIRFATLQLHTGTDTGHHTLSRTVAVYEKGQFIFENSKKGTSYAAVKHATVKASRKVSGDYQLLLPGFVWHLN